MLQLRWRAFDIRRQSHVEQYGHTDSLSGNVEAFRHVCTRRGNTSWVSTYFLIADEDLAADVAFDDVDWQELTDIRNAFARDVPCSEGASDHSEALACGISRAPLPAPESALVGHLLSLACR